MSNLSKIKRETLLSFLDTLKKQHQDDDALIAIGQIERELTSKKFGLIWEEHEEHVDIMMRTHIPVFREDSSKNIIGNCQDENYNFIIEGDNLHSLKLLEKTHRNNIDAIYIDPPYNTLRNDFIYDDEYVDPEDSFKHSKWLSFMEKRLFLCWTLLKPMGSILISINGKEIAQLRLLCDEIFGEENFVGTLTWESTTQPTNAGKAKFGLQQKAEFILMYTKNKNAKEGYRLHQYDTGKKYPDLDEKGNPCRHEIIEKSSAGSYNRDTMKFKILGQEPREGKRWQIGEKTARELEANGRVAIVDGVVKKRVYPEDELVDVKYDPFWSHLSAGVYGTAQTGKAELKKILGYDHGFDTVKPVDLIRELLFHVVGNNEDAIILDCFAGSGTTGQAVMELNTIYGGKRKFILCTNNDNNICSNILMPRIKNIVTGAREDGSYCSEGIDTNVVYYKTDFLDKNEENLVEELAKHSIEMIQIQNSIKLDGLKYVVIMDDDEMDEFEKNIDSYKELKIVFLYQDVLLSAAQEKLLQNITTFIIPDCYFDFELREAGELW